MDQLHIASHVIAATRQRRLMVECEPPLAKRLTAEAAHPVRRSDDQPIIDNLNDGGTERSCSLPRNVFRV
jgi:hypothetical protein